jgi:hypothetical protein
MNAIKPGDLVVIFKACFAQKINSDEFVWVDRSNDPQLVLWVTSRCDSDTGDPDVGIILNLEKTKGVYVLPQNALVQA